MNEVNKPKKPLVYYYFIVTIMLFLFNLIIMPEMAKKIQTDNIEKLDEIAKFLYEKETITSEEFTNILNS